MESEISSPKRISDLVALKQEGARITCIPIFEVIPVDFLHRDNPYQAHVFLCRFEGEVDGQKYSFRKCYARGCPNNLCPHVSQAVMIANRYLQRDYRELKNAGIEVEEKLFTLEDMLVKFEGYKEEHDPTLTIDDYINMAKEGTEVEVSIEVEYVPAVEHFANYKNSQTFLTVDFTVEALGRRHNFQRCFACYQTDKEKEEKDQQVRVANARLEELYKRFDDAGVKYVKKFFS
ncbi:MAG: hypothetical protein DRH12_02660 [Deltaproteobacteria bacterium]|nr:MAG: hypothetical protein DRH12_02660 [Deltaproteobacteria bacterium]